MKQEKIYLDISKGGNGEIWMLLVSFYAVGGLKPHLKFYLFVPKFLRKLSSDCFGDRIEFIEDNERHLVKRKFTTVGLKDLLPGLVKGERYISPYQRLNIFDKKLNGFKDKVNIALFKVMDALNLVLVPPIKWHNTYFGFQELTALKQVRDVDYKDFTRQVHEDFPKVKARMDVGHPVSPELVIPADLPQNVIFFPTGTSKQFVPVKWAKQYYPDAYYAIFHGDDGVVKLFQKHNMKIILFYKEPGDIITLAKTARWAICTDSFPSHIIQSCHDRCTTLITEYQIERVVNPAFRGKVVNAEVSCHPCGRTGWGNPCAAGYTECLNWKNETYSQNIIQSVGA